MTITISPTDKIVELKNRPFGESVPARIWEGKTEDGIHVHCLITRISIREDESADVHARFAAALQETKKPSADVVAYPLSMIL